MQQSGQTTNLPLLILNQAEFAVVVSNKNGEVLFANRAFEQITGILVKDGDVLLGVPLSFFRKKEDREAVILLYKTQLLEKKQSISYEFLRASESDEEVWLKMHSQVYREKESDEYLFIHWIKDISEQKLQERKLIEQKKKAEDNDRLKSAFLANMSHEIRTPMNTLIGFSKLLTETMEPSEREQFSEIIQSSGAHLLRLINDIIDISKIEAGFHDIKLLPVNINGVLNELYKFYLHDKRMFAKSLNLEVQAGLPIEEASVLTDETRLRQVISNLIDNAIKFTSTGEIRFGYNLIDETYNDGTHKLLFYVKDSGVGIPKNEQKRIFDRFHQVNEENKKIGTGLGLSIVQTLIKKLGGDIWVESVPGEGSTFFFTIPYLQKKHDEDLLQEKNTEEAIPDLENKVILIAEDMQSNYQFLEVLLRKTKATLVWAKNGKEAVKEVLSERAIDLVLMDLRMPIMNGYNATRQIKLLKPKLPVIAVTAYAIDGDMEKAFDFGCDDYITKPVLSEELYQKVKMFIY